jgi:hypothetical protein
MESGRKERRGEGKGAGKHKKGVDGREGEQGGEENPLGSIW